MLEYTLLAAGIIGFIAMGAFLAIRLYNNPLLLVGLGTVLWNQLVPVIWRAISKRMSPEEEAKWRKEQSTSANPPGMKTKFPKRDR
jgi:hypothetical protein